MAIGSGLSAQVMLALEGGYGATTTPTQAIEFNECGLKFEPGTLESRSSGRLFLPSGRSRRYTRQAGGNLALDFMNQGMGKLLKLMFGHVTGPTQVLSTVEYVQTHTPDSTGGGAGISAVIQHGIPTVAGVVEPFTFHGCKVTAWELVQEVDQNLRLSLTIDAKPQSDTATALASASYPADLTPLAFLDAVITIGGSSVDLKTLTLSHQRALATDRRFLGNTKKEPIANGEWVYGGSFDKEFEDTDLYDAFVAGETAALVATWSYGEIGATGNPYKLVITLPEIRYDGENPTVAGSNIAMQRVPFKALDNGTDPVISAAYHSTDTTL